MPIVNKPEGGAPRKHRQLQPLTPAGKPLPRPIMMPGTPRPDPDAWQPELPPLSPEEQKKISRGG